MPLGVTPTRARRRQSDAKWRASVAMCYNIMKNVIPNQKKLGRRKVSKALTLKETEKHIANLERRLRELIQERAPLCGKMIMIQNGDSELVPASLEDVKQDFALKQHALFNCTTTGTKKRYNVPSDIEASLDQLSQQSCDLTVLNRSEVEEMFPDILRIMDTPRFKPQCTEEQKLGELLTTPAEAVKGHGQELPKLKTPIENPREPKAVLVYTSKKDTAKTHSKACKQLSFSSKYQDLDEEPKVNKTSAADHMVSKATTGIKDMVTKIPINVKHEVTSTPIKTKHVVANTPTQDSGFSSQVSPPVSTPSQLTVTTPKSSSYKSRTATQRSKQMLNGFTPVKLPYGLNDHDPLMVSPGTPLKFTVGSPLSCFSMPQTPVSCFDVGECFEFSDNEDVTGLLCTESIDSIDLALQPNDKLPQKQRMDVGTVEEMRLSEDADRKPRQTKCRRRLDKLYDVTDDQTVPNPDESCLEFDGYLLFLKHNASLMEPNCSPAEKALTTAHMWEKLEPEDRAVYAKMASIDQSDDSNDLSADLLGIDLKPLHKEHTEVMIDEAGAGEVYEGSQEVPSLILDLSENVHADFQRHFLEGYEDLGVFYTANDKQDVGDCGDYDFIEEQSSQVVPQM